MLANAADVRGVPLTLVDVNMNGLLNLRIISDLGGEPPLFLRRWFDFFSFALPLVAAGARSKEDTAKQFALTSTGLSADLVTLANKSDASVRAHNYAILNIACLERNFTRLVSLLTELIAAPRFDEYAHIHTLLRNVASDTAESLLDNALRYATSLSASTLVPQYAINEKLDSARFLYSLAHSLEQQPSTVRKDVLEDLHL